MRSKRERDGKMERNEESRNLTFTYIDEPLVRQHYLFELHNSQRRGQATRKRAGQGSILAIGSRGPRL